MKYLFAIIVATSGVDTATQRFYLEEDKQIIEANDHKNERVDLFNLEEDQAVIDVHDHGKRKEGEPSIASQSVF